MVCFYFMPSRRLLQYIDTTLQNTCIYLILSFSKIQKEVWNLAPCLIFCIISEAKYFSWCILLIDQVSLSGCLYFARYWAICVLQLFVNEVNKLLEGEGPILMTPIDSINNQNIVTIARVNIPSYMIFPWIM